MTTENQENNNVVATPPVPNTPESHPQDGVVPKDERDWAVIAHVLAIFTGFIGPLIVWLIKKDDMPFVDKQAKEQLNFQIVVIIASVISYALCFIFIGFLMLPVIIIGSLIFCILAAVNAKDGIDYKIPFNIRLIS